MKEENFEDCLKEFNKYVSNYDFSNEMISRKYYHSLRVVKYAEQIAKSENLNTHDFYLAQVTALLHDISRFRQATEYGTFIDSKSFDHGDVAYEILKENNYVLKYVNSEEDKNIVLKAVKNHNKYSIEDGLTERELYFAKIIRDSDKIDILDSQLNQVTDGESIIFEEVLKSINDHKLFHNSNSVINNVSIIGAQICFIFDLYFKETYKIIGEKKIIQRKIEVLRKNVDKNIVDEIENSINLFLHSK